MIEKEFMLLLSAFGYDKENLTAIDINHLSIFTTVQLINDVIISNFGSEEIKINVTDLEERLSLVNKNLKIMGRSTIDLNLDADRLQEYYNSLNVSIELIEDSGLSYLVITKMSE